MSEGLANVLKIVGFILYPYLGFNDLLRLRRLCKWSKVLAEDYIRLKASTQRCIEVSLNHEHQNNLSSFVNLSFTVPLCHVYIGNIRDGNQIWDRNMEKHLTKFLTLYGQKITHLELWYLELTMGSKALSFFESLPQLEHLEIGLVELKIKKKWLNGLVLPSTFRKLKKLCIKQYIWSPGEQNTAYKREVFEKLLEWCQPCLESFQQPFCSYLPLNEPVEIFEPVRTTLIQVENPKLKIYDLNRRGASFIDPVAAGMDFYRLLTACYQNNVKLCNVNADMIEQMFQLDSDALEDLEEKLSGVIVSLFRVRNDCFYLELSNLEAMEIRQAYKGSLSFPEEEFERKTWSNLKRLRFVVNGHETTMRQLLNYFFVEIQREKMEQLDLEFVNVYWYQNRACTVPFPKALDIGKSSPNLKQLHLSGWPENNIAISKLWEMLPLLEVLEFESCYELTIEAFIGENRKEPSFFQLKNLHKLTLRNLNSMPKITDDLFVTVLRHMPLKELYLGARYGRNTPRPVSQITVAGIRSLHIGVFAESIERFPLKGYLKLENVSEKKLSLLEKEFRSYDML